MPWVGIVSPASSKLAEKTTWPLGSGASPRRRSSAPIQLWTGCSPFPLVWVDRQLLPRQHRLGLALEVDEGLAAHVDRDPLDRAAREAPGRVARIVVGDLVRRCRARRTGPRRRS